MVEEFWFSPQTSGAEMEFVDDGGWADFFDVFD